VLYQPQQTVQKCSDQNHFGKPNQHVFTFLHLILICRFTYRASLEMHWCQSPSVLISLDLVSGDSKGYVVIINCSKRNDQMTNYFNVLLWYIYNFIYFYYYFLKLKFYITSCGCKLIGFYIGQIWIGSPLPPSKIIHIPIYKSKNQNKTNIDIVSTVFILLKKKETIDNMQTVEIK
jgi:hypothetical protein